MNTVGIGDVGEAIAVVEFTQQGFMVSKPLSNNARYDLIVDKDNKLYRVQVKTTQSIKDGKMIFSTKTMNYTQGAIKSTRYEKEEVDLFFLYCVENGWKGLFNVQEVEQIPTELKIRIAPTKNGQRIGIRFAEDYEFYKQLNASFV